MIKGIEKLTEDQKRYMERVNKLHTDCVGLDYKAGMKIVETWVDKRNNICVRLKKWGLVSLFKRWHLVLKLNKDKLKGDIKDD